MQVITPNFELDLNREQFQVVETLEGAVLVVAGAGSGKTRTLVYRVAKLISRGVEPSAILLLTFTRKAASEMLSRVARLVGDAGHRVDGGTFHSFSHRMLRTYCHYAGYPSSFTIMDRGDVQNLLQLLAREMGLIGKKRNRNFPNKNAVASIFSKKVNTELEITELLRKQYPHLEMIATDLQRLFTAYSNYKKKHALMDYDDLLYIWRDILREHAPVRHSVGDRYKFIMVDEYQDTNPVQADIIRLVSELHGNVMVVGDDAQSIYAFRGATIRNILDFPKIFSNVRIIRLERNYRSTQPNLDCTNAIIANASDKYAKRLVAQRKGGVRPAFYRAFDEDDQARFVAGNILQMFQKGMEPHEIAVLFRAGFHSYRLETTLNRMGIAFEKRGGLKLVDTAHVKDMLAILRLVENPLDHLSFNRVCMLLDGIGTKTADKIFSEIIRADDPLYLLASWTGRAKWNDELRRVGALLLDMTKNSHDIQAVIDMAMEWYSPFLERDHMEDYPVRLQELKQLRAMSDRHETLAELLADLTIDPPEGSSERDSGKRIVLSTMHSAKGLEWKAVFVISLAEGRMPSPVATNRPEDIEEERRLFYVASTRAKDLLFFCSPRFINTSGAGLIPVSISRFIHELPEDLLDIKSRYDEQAVTAQPPSTSHEIASDQTTSAYSREDFSAGCKVRHSIFGRGTVMEVVGHMKVKVRFDTGGIKILRTDHASLSRV